MQGQGRVRRNRRQAKNEEGPVDVLLSARDPADIDGDILSSNPSWSDSDVAGKGKRGSAVAAGIDESKDILSESGTRGGSERNNDNNSFGGEFAGMEIQQVDMVGDLDGDGEGRTSSRSRPSTPGTLDAEPLSPQKQKQQQGGDGAGSASNSNNSIALRRAASKQLMRVGSSADQSAAGSSGRLAKHRSGVRFSADIGTGGGAGGDGINEGEGDHSGRPRRAYAKLGKGDPTAQEGVTPVASADANDTTAMLSAMLAAQAAIEAQDSSTTPAVIGDDSGAGSRKTGSSNSGTAKRRMSRKEANQAKVRDNLLPRPRRPVEWREHAMVQKLIGEPIILMVPVPIPVSEGAKLNAGGVKALNRGTMRGIGTRMSTGSFLPVAAADSAAMKAAAAAGSLALAGKLEEAERKRHAGIRTSTGQVGAHIHPGLAGLQNWAGNDGLKRYTIKEVPLLGKKSFWLESRRQQAELRGLREEQLEAERVRRMSAPTFKPFKMPEEKPPQDEFPSPALSRQSSSRPTSGFGAQPLGLISALDAGQDASASGNNFPFWEGPPGSASASASASNKLFTPAGVSPGLSARNRDSYNGRGGAGDSSQPGTTNSQPSSPAAVVSRRNSVLQLMDFDLGSVPGSRATTAERKERFLTELHDRIEERYVPKDA